MDTKVLRGLEEKGGEKECYPEVRKLLSQGIGWTPAVFAPGSSPGGQYRNPASTKGAPWGQCWICCCSVQLLSHVWLFATPRTAPRQASLSITNSQSLLKLMSIALLIPWNHLVLCCLLLLLPSIYPSIRVFSNESVLHIRWPKYWSFSFSISPSNEYSGPISFRMNWLDLCTVQGTQESSPTPQFKSINSLVLSFLYSPTLTSIHDYWKNHSFD